MRFAIGLDDCVELTSDTLVSVLACIAAGKRHSMLRELGGCAAEREVAIDPRKKEEHIERSNMVFSHIVLNIRLESCKWCELLRM